jgi:asparagine synthase (glutamine-hydrolysing)
MCGIVGAIGSIAPEVEAAVRAMNAAQVHRGPDQEGFYSAGHGPGVVFGFRRLAILDLSPAGHQPMVDRERGNVLVFNGEIYNHAELRDELAGLGESFTSSGDTEVLLKAYGRWGRGALERLRGMFAFAVYDPRARAVLFARDRLGIKPLYHATVERPGGGRVVLFASELRALLASGIVRRTLDRTAVASYLWNGFVPGPTTMVEGIELLSPGNASELSVETPAVKPRPYWTLGAVTATAGGGRARLEAELETAAREHLMSDVPLGIFLSGGVDSSAVTALATRNSRTEVQTFHVSFEEAAFDESHHAAAVAKALGTQHHEYKLTQERFRDGLDAALAGLDQPTFDAINTYFVSRVVREAGFTVALAGTGGDEVFGGYRSFRDLPRASRVARLLRSIPRGAVRGLARVAGEALGTDGVPPQTRWGKLGDLLSTRGDPVEAYQVAYGLFTRDFHAALCRDDMSALAPHGLSPARTAELRTLVADKSALAAISILELSLFLGERLLRDSDAASMAVSLELRVPLLDHRVVEAAAALGDDERFEPLGQKRLLRSLSLAGVPPEIFDRPKAGFVLPIEVWAKDRLAKDIDAVFANRALAERVGLEADALRRLMSAFRDGAKGLYWSRVWAPYVLLRWCDAHGVALA